jgi:glycopeptide antibiotics resistance protein
MSKIVFFKLIFFGSVFVLIVLSLYPGNLISLILYGYDYTFPRSDKIYHFLSYLLMSTFGFLAYSDKNFFRLFLFLLSLGFFLEVFQLWIPNRYFEFLDLIANFSGVLLSFLLFVILHKKFFQK